MSLPSRCAGDTIAKSITRATKRPGGEMPVLIRPSLLARYGWIHIRYRRFRINSALKTRPPRSSTPAIRETPSLVGGPANEAQRIKRSQLRKRLSLNDFVQADGGQPAQCS